MTTPELASVPTDTYAFLATCPRGIESLVADELATLDAEIERTTVAGVIGRATLQTLYQMCLWSRLANRIILTLARVEDVDSAADLLKAVGDVSWETLMPDNATLRVDFHGRSEGIRHTQFGAQTVKDGVVDRFQAQGLLRPNVDPHRPDTRIYAHLHRNVLTLGIDLSGDSLHMRGYRLEGGKAPLKENLAAALLVRAGWPERARKGEVLVDPMCGAGTLLIEGALMACDIAPNLGRPRWGFQGWQEHDPELWKQVEREARWRAEAGKRRCRAAFIGQDVDGYVIQASASNARRAGVDQLMTLTRGDATRLTALAPNETGLVITNPPYGERIGDMPALVPLYSELGARLRQHYPGWSVALFTGNPELGYRLGMKAHKQYSFFNGALACKLFLFEIRTTEERQAVAEAHGNLTPEGEVMEAPSLSEGAQMFANRLRKNIKRLAKWRKRSGVQCYRLYDADMPEYALAIDIYGSRVHVQEYVAPKGIDPRQAERRLMEALTVLPQVLDVASDHIYLKRRQRQAGKAQYTRQSNSQERLVVEEGKAKLWVNLRDYLDTGLFLDHRPVRLMLGEMASGKRVLNLFCYTATATVHMALGGARESISVDMSNTYLDWGRDNFELNRIDLRRHRLEREDCLKWLAEDRSQFDLIFLDPPTFSNSKKMEATFDVQRDQIPLINSAMARLAKNGTLVFSNNQRRFKLEPSLAEYYDVEDITSRTLDPDFQRRPDIHKVFVIRHR